MRKKEAIEKVFTASLKVFAEYGYKKATVEEIAAELGMTKGNLYLYVKNKKDLYHRTVSHAMLQWQGMVRSRVEKEQNAENMFLVMCEKAVEYLSRHDELRRLLIRDPDIFPMFAKVDPYHEINRASVEMIKRILEAGIREGRFREVDTERVSEVIFSIYKMFIIRMYIKEENQSVYQLFEDTVDLITTGLFIREHC